MHTASYRANALFTMASTMLGALCILATLTDIVRTTNPPVSRPSVVMEGLQVILLLKQLPEILYTSSCGEAVLMAAASGF